MHVTNVKTKRDEDRWEFEVTAEIPAEAITQWRGKALTQMAREAQIDGFRAGKAPEELVLARVGEAALLERAASEAVRHELPEILAKEQANIVDAPKVVIATPIPGKPVSFTARAPLAPQITLPDYKKIAAEVRATKQGQSVSDEEHAQALAHLKRERARIEKVEAGTDPKEAAEHAKAMVEADLPALDDDFAKSLGYEGEGAFEDAVRGNIKNEKELHEAEKRRATLLEKLVKQAQVKYPAIMREYELDEMEARMAGDVESMGTTLDAYLTHAKKTKENLRKEWAEAADTRAKVRLILGEIARTEKIEPDSETLEREVARAKQHYKNADEATLRAHIAHAMKNEAVLGFLERDSASD